MKWEQIETRWAEMTRRIRADYVADRIEPSGRAIQGMKRGNVLSISIADSVTSSAKDPEFKTSAK